MTVVVRMPDGSRQGRRFLKTDKLQVNNFVLPESRTKTLIRLVCSVLLSFFYSEHLILASWLAVVCLQFLFDFLDIGRTFKPGTYRLVILYHCILIKFCMYIEKNVPVSCFRKLRVTFMINQDTPTFDQFLMQASVALNIRL